MKPERSPSTSLDAEVDEDGLSALLDDPAFQAVQARMSRFNLFEALGAVRGELRHSNFLAYLLSPARNHGFGSRPLVGLLRAMLERLPISERPLMTLELMVSDLADAVVHRERDNIDITIELSSLRLVVVIENKIGAQAGRGQLERYHALVAARYPHHRRLYVFLTPDGLEPDHPAYLAFSYAQLAGMLEALVQDAAAETESALIVRHYVQMLRRHIVPDPHLRELAARLYERHRPALDFIMECAPQRDDLLGLLAETVETTPGLTIDSRGVNMLRFVPDAWDRSLTTIRCDAALWSRSGRPLLFEVKTPVGSPGRVNVALLIGPAPAEDRSVFYEAASAERELFRGLVKPMGTKWATIFSQDLLSSAQARDLTLEQQVETAVQAWSEFQAVSLPALIRAVIEIDAQRIPTTPARLSAGAMTLAGGS